MTAHEPPDTHETRGRTPVLERHLEPQTGAAFEVLAGQVVRVTSPTGEQVSDLTAFGLRDTREWLSSGRTIDYANTIALTEGHTLFSNRSNPMFTITADTVGTHDFLLAPCSPEMFQRLYGLEGEHPSCFMNLARALAPFGIRPDQVPTAFNIFMSVNVLPSGELRIDPPPCRAGDYLELRAEIDLVVGVTACSAELTNNGAFKPIDVTILAQ
ncbi:MAG: urea carboxylase-associated family protein [Dehalococcoidia bacterium]|nr:urea carboxylase-associated family protein [Dehalococcoidia bacterium]